MDLAEDVIEGLHLAGDSVHLPDQGFLLLLKSVSESIVDRRPTDPHLGAKKEFGSFDQGTLKQVYASLAALLLEAAKLDKDVAAVSQVLEDCKFSQERIKQLIAVYQQYKQPLRSILSKIGSNPPHVVDVDWRLDYYIKNNNLEKVSRPVFLIDLKTQVNASEEVETVQIACTQDQLQDLVGKLRDACKGLERVAQL